MADCYDVFKMVDEGDSFQSWNGLRGPYYIPHLSADGVLSWTNTGNLPNPAPVDISGPPGVSVELRGPVASVQDLPATASSSELWLVGTASPYDGYFFNGVQWENAGPISVGPPGPAGEDGVSPEISVTDITGGHRVTITDAGGTETFDVMDGEDGGPGPAGTSAGFGTPTATVDQTTGTPSVTVTASGPDTAKVFAFAFSGIKGESGGGGGGTSNYNDLSNKPQIQGVTLSGNKTASDLGLALATEVLPAGGSTRDVLIKSSNTDYDTQWATLYSSATPNMDGTGSAGISSTFSRSDHVHPKDITKQDKIIASGILKSDGSGGVSAAVAGTDYLTPATAYSPIKVVSANYSLTADDVGKTILTPNTAVTITLPSSVVSAVPIGAEFAFSSNYTTTNATFDLTAITNPYTNINGTATRCERFRMTAGFDMVVIKRLSNATWGIYGNVEVVT